MTLKKTLLAASALTLAFAGSAAAEMSARATTDLNLRAGPGPGHEVVGVIPADAQVTLVGCIEGSQWCRVTYDGTEAWAFSAYLTGEFSGDRVVVSERIEAVPRATFEGSGTAAGGTAGMTTGAVGGAVIGSIIGGPIGAAVGAVGGAAAGGVTGTAVGAAFEPPPQRVRSYVVDNRPEPVYLEGEVVAGARLPEVVELRQIPDYEYRFAYVNGVPVIVEPAERRILYVVR